MNRRTFLKAVGVSLALPLTHSAIAGENGKFYETVFCTTPQSITFLPGEVIRTWLGSRRLVKRVTETRVDDYSYNRSNNLTYHRYVTRYPNNFYVVETVYMYDSQDRMTKVDRESYFHDSQYKECSLIEFDYSTGKQKRTESCFAKNNRPCSIKSFG